MSEQKLRKGLIRLAYQNPELRPVLLPMLHEAGNFTLQVVLEIEHCSGYDSPIDRDNDCGRPTVKTKKFPSEEALFVWMKDWMPKIQRYLAKTGKPGPWKRSPNMPTTWLAKSETRRSRPGRALGESFTYETWEVTHASLAVTLNGRPLNTNLSSMVDRVLTGKTPVRQVIEQAKYEDYERRSPEEARRNRRAAKASGDVQSARATLRDIYDTINDAKRSRNNVGLRDRLMTQAMKLMAKLPKVSGKADAHLRKLKLMFDRSPISGYGDEDDFPFDKMMTEAWAARKALKP